VRPVVAYEVWHVQCVARYGPYLEDDMFDYWHGGWHMWWMTGSWLLAIVIVGLFLWIWMRGTALETPRESAESILKRRYAQGEINSDEYHQRLTDLRK
jgi:uncharacterized membrane protein